MQTGSESVCEKLKGGTGLYADPWRFRAETTGLRADPCHPVLLEQGFSHSLMTRVKRGAATGIVQAHSSFSPPLKAE
jgi:hypothetical protein